MVHACVDLKRKLFQRRYFYQRSQFYQLLITALVQTSKSASVKEMYSDICVAVKRRGIGRDRNVGRCASVPAVINR